MQAKIIDLPQGSPEWLAWRRGKRMASEASTVTGTNPWKKPAQLAKIKRGLAKDFTNAAMARGHTYEPEARAWLEASLGMIGDSVVLERDEYGASLDWRCGSVIGEIKVPSSETSELWVSGQITPYYMDQVQQQLWVSGAEVCYFCIYLPEQQQGKVSEIYPDPKRWSEIASHWDFFWRQWMTGEMPEDERNDSDWQSAVEAYKAAKVAADAADKEVETAKKFLIQLAHEQSARGFGLQLIKTSGKESYKYAEFVKSLGLEVPEKYKSVGKDSFTVKLDKE